MLLCVCVLCVGQWWLPDGVSLRAGRDHWGGGHIQCSAWPVTPAAHTRKVHRNTKCYRCGMLVRALKRSHLKGVVWSKIISGSIDSFMHITWLVPTAMIVDKAKKVPESPLFCFVVLIMALLCKEDIMGEFLLHKRQKFMENRENKYKQMLSKKTKKLTRVAWSFFQILIDRKHLFVCGLITTNYL